MRVSSRPGGEELSSLWHHYSCQEKTGLLNDFKNLDMHNIAVPTLMAIKID